jgi:AbrB family looped-hinge helix DNA binding protein
LLRVCPNLHILTTSREVLGVAGETPYLVPSLSLPATHHLSPIEELPHYEAVRLFIERAVTVLPTRGTTFSWYATEMWNTKASERRYALRLGGRGRIILPAPVRRRLALEEGDRLILSVEGDGSLRLESAREVAKRARGVLKELLPERTLSDRSLAEELIAHRRAEASRE